MKTKLVVGEFFVTKFDVQKQKKKKKAIEYCIQILDSVIISVFNVF